MGSSCTTQDRCLQVYGGLALATFKLYLAAFHLPNQVRACGASFFMLEYWVERLVQLYKRMVKYMSTAFPSVSDVCCPECGSPRFKHVAGGLCHKSGVFLPVHALG